MYPSTCDTLISNLCFTEDVARRTITLWQDGFQIEDGDLMSYDNPEDAQILADLTSGYVSRHAIDLRVFILDHSRNAPLSLLNVRPGQPVELRINPRRHEPYRPPSGVRVFRGAGQRLGAPVPEPVQGSSSSSMPGSFPASTAASPPSQGMDRASVTTRFEVDQTKPTTSIQVRLADGTR